MSRRKLNDRVIYIRSRARELAMSGRFERWQGIEFELRFAEGLLEACALLGPMRRELDILCQQARSRALIETSTESKEMLETLEELMPSLDHQHGRLYGAGAE
jgi:hypothetical protein